MFKELTDAIKETVRQIEEIVRLDYNVDPNSAKRKLRSHGIYLWNLLPEKIRDRFINRRKKIKRITIYSDNDPFPWEMLYPFRREPAFDASKFLIEQVEICRWINGSKPPSGIAVSRADFVIADPAQLAEAVSEIAKITDLLKKWNIALQNNNILVANELFALFKKDAVSLLHFACHQSFDDDAERIFIKNMPVAPDEISNLPFLAHAAAFIFLNACRSDRKVPGYTKMGGWASSFLGVGAGAFIGTLWEVRDETAAMFAEALYKALFLRGEFFGKALKYARRYVKLKAPGDPTWLAYSFYGDVDARVLRSLT